MSAQSFLMIPDSVGDRILLFDSNDGSLIDDNFIDGSETGDGIFQTPINAIQVNQEIWVSDQVADAIFRFDLQGNYLSIVNDNDGDGDTDNLDNIRGIEFINGLVYVANSGSDNDAFGDGEVVVVFDAAGNNLGFFDTGDPYDIRAYNGELLINDINSEDDGGEDIDRYSIDGVNSTLLGTFHQSDGETGIDFPQQMTLRESNGNVLVGGFSAPGGVYEYDVNGNQVNLFDADAGFANRLRAAYELENGNIIWSGGDGVIVTNPETGEDTDIYTVNNLDFRPSARYIEQLIIPGEDVNLDGAIFLADQTLDKLFLTQDLSGDGDANDSLEVSVYFDETNASGLSEPTGNIFTVLQAKDGSVFYGDGDTDSVYRLIDSNQDGDALDAGEANIWFSADNANNFPLLTPNGLAQGNDGAIYIVEADTRSTPNGDFVYRTQDLNQDGDANDAGESSIWLDLKALNPSSSPFEITFINDVAYIIDSVGIDTNVIYRAEDTDGSGSIEAGEVTVLVDETTAPIDFALASDGSSLFTLELLDNDGPQSVFKIEDGETITATEVWNSTALPEGYELFAAFSIASGPGGELAITSNGDANEDNVFRLLDLNDDGDYFDDGETIPYLSRLLTSTVPERARVVEYAREPEVVEEQPTPVFGTINADTIEVEGSNQLIFGGDSDDLIDASISSEGNNRIYASSGNDTVILGASDRIIGGAGDDKFFVTSSGDNVITGGAGADQFWIATAEIPDTVSTFEITANDAYFTFGGDVSESSDRRLLSDKATVIGFEGLDTISFLQFDLSDLPVDEIQSNLIEANLTLEYDSDLAGTLIPATAERPVSVSAYEITAPFDNVNGNVDDINYGVDGNNAVATTIVGDDGIYNWDVTELVNDELLGSNTGVNVALSGVFGNENIDDRNSYASFYPAGATDGLAPTLVIETQAVNVITDFTSGEDVLGIAGLGIGFNNLSITQQEDNTLIAVNGSDLAILEGINADSLSTDNFVFS
ncbi:MAG: DNRLRE domain-containing protein [Cyanobacteria bacterium P01_A01_bin.80]